MPGVYVWIQKGLWPLVEQYLKDTRKRLGTVVNEALKYYIMRYYHNKKDFAEGDGG